MSEPKFNPEMLTLARAGAGLTQADLAKALGVSQGMVSKYESGQVQPPPGQLERAGEVLGCRASFFTRWPKHFHLPITFHRKKVRLGAGALARIHANVVLKRIQMEVLLRSADAPENRIPAVNLREQGTTPERVARDLRVRWQMPRGPVENLTELLEGMGVIIIPTDFGTDLISGLSAYEPSDGLPPLIFIGTNCPGDRMRFTLAHELAHIVLHHHLDLPSTDCESEADRFAAEFLMPAADIRGFLTRLDLEGAAALKRTWKVSMSSLIKRAGDLELISPSRSRSLFIEMGRRGWRTHEPVEIPPEKQTLHWELATAHLDELGYSDEELSKALDTTVERLRSDYGLKTMTPSHPTLRLLKSSPS
ncbi:ImmA/IrrE family metallo-endopeptidase [Archangium violaceum]|uniref:XRE family transcriptional regulator n=1 Tax=Archangium violaceum TaxID=83451 RepID=UPI00193BF6AF|nr:XRE family transcriptional regulator [Archangium violaceum]QRK06060.1 ImmA/IrrE family metallo-endopeptidase [Archangium violaceum]